MSGGPGDGGDGAQEGGAGDFGGFAPPPFDAAAALAQLQRACRELRLTARGSGFELRGRRVAELALEDGAIAARTARRPALTPEWERRTLRTTVEQRQWIEQLKKKLSQWEREE